MIIKLLRKITHLPDGRIVENKAPEKNKSTDAGSDIVTTTDPKIVGNSIYNLGIGTNLWSRVVYIEYGTNLFLAPDESYHIELWPRSSVSKYNLVLANSIGLVDNGYRGEVLLRYKYIFQPEDFVILDESGGRRIWGVVNPATIYQKGEKVGQIVGAQTVDVEFVLSDTLPESERGTGGFGSSDKK